MDRKKVSFKHLLMVAGALALAGMMVTLAVPKAVHAAVAALVKVANPATNPVLTSRIDDSGRISYQTTVQANCTNLIGCIFSFGPVPANRRLVVEHVSGGFSFSAAPTSAGIFANINGALLSTFLMPIAPATTSGGPASSFDQPVHFYVDQNQVLSITAFTSQSFTSSPQQLTLTGYLLDCNAAPCAPIASF